LWAVCRPRTCVRGSGVCTFFRRQQRLVSVLDRLQVNGPVSVECARQQVRRWGWRRGEFRQRRTAGSWQWGGPG
jgi:hypothetical protein